MRSRSPASSASCVCRMIVFGFSSLPAPHAGQFTWQRPHSTQVNASSTVLLPEILHRLEADLLLLEVEVRQVAELRRLQEHGDRRQHQVQVLRRGDQRQEREDHEHVRPPVHAPGHACASSSRNVSRNVIISVAMNSAMTTDSIDTCVAEADRPDERAADEQVDDAAEDGRRQTASARGDRRGTSRVCVRSTMPRPYEKLDGRVAAERDEAPEHERVRQAGDRPLADRPPLQRRRRRTKRLDAERRGCRARRCSGAAAIRRTRVATCAANAPTKATTRSQNAASACTTQRSQSPQRSHALRARDALRTVMPSGPRSSPERSRTDRRRCRSRRLRRSARRDPC